MLRGSEVSKDSYHSPDEGKDRGCSCATVASLSPLSFSKKELENITNKVVFSPCNRRQRVAVTTNQL